MLLWPDFGIGRYRFVLAFQLRRARPDRQFGDGLGRTADKAV